MAEVLKTIKADGTGDYSTISAWQALLDDTGIYNAGDDAIGEIYSGTYNEQATVDNGSTIGLNSVTLRAHSSARHSGRSGTGVRVVCQGANPFWGASLSATPTYNFEWFEYDGNGMDDSEIIALQAGSTTRCRNLIVHNALHTSTTFNCYGIRARGTNDNHEIDNCLVYNVELTGAGQRITGILLENTTTGKVRNCTVTDIRQTNATSGNAEGINFLDSANHTIQNNLVTNIQSTAGTAECYDNATVVNAVTAGNVSDDATSPQTGLRNKTITFEDSALDLYWLADSDTDAVGVGSDLGSGQIALDLFGRDRDAKGDTWDAGAFQYVEGIPYFVGGAEESGASVTSLTVTHGVTIEAGDVLVCVFHHNTSGSNLQGDGTYTFTREYIEENPSAGDGTIAFFTRIATASEPASYTFNSNASAARGQLSFMVFRKVNTSNIWQIAPSAAVRDWDDAWTSPVAPTITTTTDYAFGMVTFYRDSGTSMENVTNGYDHEVQSLGVDRQQCVAVWSRLWTNAGATGTTQATNSSSTGGIAFQYALNPSTPLGPVITDVDTDETWDDGSTGLVITGTGFV